MACWLPPVHEVDPSFVGKGGSLQGVLEPVSSIKHLSSEESSPCLTPLCLFRTQRHYSKSASSDLGGPNHD